ncbi:MAG: hypothetical protein RLZZ621_2412 [Gemmatimonadota bacterium]
MTALLTTPHPETFGELPSAAVAPRSADWMSSNAEGLMLAATDDWQGAREAFRTAAMAIEADGQTTASAGQHSPLALVLSNLAQSLYKSGAVAEAITCQERVVALRTAMTGEGSVAVARSRSDLAAMLGSIGRVEEAAVLARRALMAVESSGAPDMALAAVLANAARIAIVAEATQDAEPILRRLHAVEARCGMDSTATDQLLARIGAAPVTPPAGSPMLVDLDDVFPAPSQAAPIPPTVRYPSPAPLAFTHEIEFVDDVVSEQDADESPVGEYPRFPTSEQAAQAYDVRTEPTWEAPALPTSGAYDLVASSEAPVAAAWESTEMDESTDVIESTVPTTAESDALTDSSLERRVADRRDADRRDADRRLADRRSPRQRHLLIAGSVVLVVGLAVTLAIVL